MYKLFVIAALVAVVACVDKPATTKAPIVAPLAVVPGFPFASPLAYTRGAYPYSGYNTYPYNTYPYNQYQSQYYGGDYYGQGADYYNRGFYGRSGYPNYPYYNQYAPVARTAPVFIPPVVRAAPAVIPPVVRAAPVVIPPVVRAAPVVIPPVVRAAPLSTAEGNARILGQDQDVKPDGSYQYHYETENGIQAQERNVPKVDPTGQVVVNTVEGTYSYVAPNGEQVSVSYVADENGYQPLLNGTPVVKK